MARGLAAVTAVALAVVLSLDWFAVAPHPAPQTGGGSGILNLLNTYSLKGFHASGWAGLGWLTVALLALAAAGALAGPRWPAVAVAVIAAIAVVVRLADRDDAVVDLRWPAYAGAGLALVLVVAAAWPPLAGRRVPSGA